MKGERKWRRVSKPQPAPTLRNIHYLDAAADMLIDMDEQECTGWTIYLLERIDSGRAAKSSIGVARTAWLDDLWHAIDTEQVNFRFRKIDRRRMEEIARMLGGNNTSAIRFALRHTWFMLRKQEAEARRNV